MQHRPNLLHLLIVPVIALVACNGLTQVLLWQITGDRSSYFKAVTVVVTVCYGLYLHWFRYSKRDHRWDLIALGLGAAVMVYVELPTTLWVGVAASLFSVMRITLLHADKQIFPKDLTAVLAGLAVALFLVPASLAAAVAAFVLVQLIYEMSRMTPGQQPLSGDRFKEGLRTAERILDMTVHSRT